jgi:hypothetical protein
VGRTGGGARAADSERLAQWASARALAVRADAIKAWEQIAGALAGSTDPADVRLAGEAVRYLTEVAPDGQGAALIAAQRAKRYEDSRSTGARAAPTGKRDQAQTLNR